MDSLANDTLELAVAYDQKDWQRVFKLVIKIKGGAIYCGTLRLLQVCNIIEQFWYDANNAFRELLYYRLVQTIEETNAAINIWSRKAELADN